MELEENRSHLTGLNGGILRRPKSLRKLCDDRENRNRVFNGSVRLQVPKALEVV